jgi:hypothetical protein
MLSNIFITENGFPTQDMPSVVNGKLSKTMLPTIQMSHLNLGGGGGAVTLVPKESNSQVDLVQ